MAQSLLLESLALTSTTLVTAITNLIPAITFLLAIPFRYVLSNSDFHYLVICKNSPLNEPLQEEWKNSKLEQKQEKPKFAGL